MISNKAEYMDDGTWTKVVKVAAPGIITVKVINAALCFAYFLSIYLNLHICPSNLSTDDM